MRYLSSGDKEGRNEIENRIYDAVMRSTEGDFIDKHQLCVLFPCGSLHICIFLPLLTSLYVQIEEHERERKQKKK